MAISEEAAADENQPSSCKAGMAMARGNVSRYLLYEGGTLMLSLKNECQFRVMEMVSVEWLSVV